MIFWYLTTSLKNTLPISQHPVKFYSSVSFFSIRLNLLVAFSFVSIFCFAQQPEVKLLRVYKDFTDRGDYLFFDAKPTRDKGFIMVGADSSFTTLTNYKRYLLNKLSAGLNFWMIKVDSNGQQSWVRHDYNYSPAYSSVQQSTDGGYIAAGSGGGSNYPAEPGIFYIRKVNGNGTLQWVKQFNGSGADRANAIIQTADGGFLAAGSTTSNNGDIMGNHFATTDDAWLIKVDAAGTVQWKKCFGGTGWDTAHAIIQTPDKGYLIAGSATSGNGDLTGNKGNADGWLFKTDNLGNLQWQKNFGGSGTDVLNSVTLTTDGGIIAGGYTFSNDGDVSANHGNADVWAIKTDASGNLLWSKCFGGSADEYSLSIQRTLNNDYLLGGFTESADGDVKGQNGGADMWMLLISAEGNLVWQKCAGTVNNEYGATAFALSAFDFAIAGSVADNGSRTAGVLNGGLLLLGNANVIKGGAFLDLNLNGVQDNGEPNFDQLQINTAKNSITQSTVPYNGQFRLYTDSGTFTTSVLSASSLFSVVPASHVSTFTGYFNTDSFSVAVQPTVSQPDLAVTVLPVNGAARPGFFVRYKLMYANHGTVPVNNGTLIFIKDARTSFLSASVNPVSTSGDTLRWNAAVLNPFDSASILVDLLNSAPPTLNIGDTIRFTAAIGHAANDLSPQDDTARLKLVISGSYDPNDKSEIHAGGISTRQLFDGDWLTYLIRFQNTGNDTAFSVIVRDTLDNKLDWNSLQMISSSHPYRLSVNNGNQLAWSFPDSKLPDSNRNELLSHGYIAYRIKPKSTVVAGDLINNTAAIYFDFNLPVITNTLHTTITAASLPLPVLAGLQNNYCGNQGVQKIKIINPPAAGSSTKVYVKLDETILPVAADSTFGINTSAAGIGIHQLLISFVNGNMGDTLMSRLVINPAVSPDVNISANITNVVNLANPVVITATNAADGGTSPKYTFAIDRGITNILQAESSSNTLTIQPNTLTVGSNWIYVSMKTSDTCFTVQTNVDSIDIERSAITGLTDVDFPAQIINVYPNPFAGIINVSGLNTGKIYTINISNTLGQKVYSQQVTSSSTLSINKGRLQSGRYWLSIFDYKKRKLIGTVPVIKE